MRAPEKTVRPDEPETSPFMKNARPAVPSVTALLKMLPLRTVLSAVALNKTGQSNVMRAARLSYVVVLDENGAASVISSVPPVIRHSPASA